jgi:hypothetical protein
MLALRSLPYPFSQRLKSRLKRREVGLRRLKEESAQADFALSQPGIYSLGAKVSGSESLRSTLRLFALGAACLTLTCCRTTARAQEEPGGLDHLADAKSFVSGRAASTDPNHHNGDARRLEPGQTLTLVDVKGTGRLTHFWFTIAPPTGVPLQELVLRMTWDDAPKPAVECPIGEFFVQGHGKYIEFTSDPVVIGSARSLNCYWPMPFAKHALVTITNEGTVPIDALYFNIDYRLDKKKPKQMRYFHTQYHTYFPAPTGQDLTLLDTTGSGHYVGCNISVLANSNGWWGEGNDKFYVDGATTPTIEGTGSEDYFCGAWDFGKAFWTPYFGVPYYMGEHRGDRTTCYRWHIKDPVPFTKSLKFTLEHGRSGPDDTRKPFTNHYVTVAYYYLDQPSDDTPPIPPLSQRIPQLIPLPDETPK